MAEQGLALTAGQSAGWKDLHRHAFQYWMGRLAWADGRTDDTAAIQRALDAPFDLTDVPLRDPLTMKPVEK